MPIATIPMDQVGPSCQRCHVPATALYTWEESVWGRAAKRYSLLCATCSVKVLEQVTSYEADGELRYYRPNSNMSMKLTFNYERPMRPEWEPLPPQYKPKQLSPTVVVALIRNMTHDQRTDRSNYKGAPLRKWLTSVECAGCHVKYTLVKAKKCPGCGMTNEPTARA